jgi:putative hydrolase of HD superfamily
MEVFFMSKAQNFIEFYKTCSILIVRIRTGWQDWGVKKERLESVAEHIFKTQITAIGMHSEYEYEDVDINKVIFMLVIHDLAEALIGDLTPFQITKEKKKMLEHEAFRKIFQGMLEGNRIIELFLEYDAGQTKEAQFAQMCDKLECNLQCKLYDMEHCVDLNNQENNETFNNPKVQALLNEGNSWSDMWIKFDLDRTYYDDNFKEVLQCAMEFDKE